jgi:hypothetical protein
MNKIKKVVVYSFCTLLSVFASSCTNTQAMNELNTLEAPIILIGKGKDGSVTLCDKNNKYLTINTNYYLAKTIHGSYIKGDTLISQNYR